MLQKFFAISIIFLVAFPIIKYVLPIWRFMLRTDATIKMYDRCKSLLRRGFMKGEKIEVSYGKYKLNFSNTNEACTEFEKLIKEALKCYDNLGNIIVKELFKAEKEKLLSMIDDIELRKKQGN